MRKTITVLAAVVGLGALTACTPRELAAWVDWNNQDPAAAQAFANTPEVQASLAAGQQQEAAPAPAEDSGDQGLTNNHGSRWDKIARCESGGNWGYPLVTNRTGTYSGGLMIWTKAWAAYGGKQFAPNAYQASKAQQIEVAERILADQGWGAWDCA